MSENMELCFHKLYAFLLILAAILFTIAGAIFVIDLVTSAEELLAKAVKLMFVAVLAIAIPIFIELAIEEYNEDCW